MKLVPLTKGKFAMVDDEDFDRVNQFKWQHAKARPNTVEYAVRTVNVDGKRKTQMMHRFILGHTTESTDHIDGNGLNNQKENLRPATRTENGRNRRIQKHSSEYKGVSFFKASKTPKWQARATNSGNDVHLGYFESPELAAIAYDQYAQIHYGQFAKTNKQIGVL